VALYHSSSYDARPEHRAWNWLHCLLGRPFDRNERPLIISAVRLRFSVASEQFWSGMRPGLTRGLLTHFRFHSTRQTLKPYEAAHSFLSSTELRHTHARTVTTLAVAYCKVMLCNTHPMSVGSTGRKARESQMLMSEA
jgi:hypothetical protein